MANLSRWDPFQDLLAVQDEMNQVFGRALGRSERSADETATRAWAPALDIAERNDAYVVTVEVPGVKEEQYHRIERRYGAFRRSITLPARVKADAIEASFADGLLQVVVPKAEEAKPKRIEVRPRESVEGTSSTA